MISVDKVRGSLLGLALGDAGGAPYEGGPVERLLWRFMGTTSTGLRRFTDDTQMALDLAESLIARGALDPDDLAARFAASYRWSRGYGPGAARVLKQIRAGKPWHEANTSVYPQGSFGNGAAMRAPVVGLFFHRDRTQLLEAARQSAVITHAHPLAVEGAQLLALATASALSSENIFDVTASAATNDDFVARFDIARTWLNAGQNASPKDVRAKLGMSIAATESCVTAIYVATRFLDEPLKSLLDFVAACGGDVDTVGAMAGAVWGAKHGVKEIPAEAIKALEDHQKIDATAVALHQKSTDPAA